ncbi:ABC transporter ATP-binding protein [Salinibacterium sp. ZJ454]|uniref:ABC transporter ATP-binding protein n=1 Tax=Salinibacterium sp. ZJ454 TaxID=2708339 RepID=UPI001FBB4058|nr:ABC transporter ATP-binding protein [Salinibacterium sp. ZJ454]
METEPDASELATPHQATPAEAPDARQTAPRKSTASAQSAAKRPVRRTTASRASAAVPTTVTADTSAGTQETPTDAATDAAPEVTPVAPPTPDQSDPTADSTAGPATAEAPAPTTTSAAPAPKKAPAKRAPAKRAPVKPAPKRTPKPPTPVAEVVLRIEGLSKRFGDTVAVNGINLEVRAGSFFGLVGPNGAGKTTTLSMVTGLLRPDAGLITIHGADVWNNPVVAKRNMGVLPDQLRLFDRLTGAQLLHYAGTLRGLDPESVRVRSADLAHAFGLTDALDRLVTDYSAGMTKKIALASAMIHSPRVLVLDEPFESVDPVSAANVIEILQRYVKAGGTVVLSSHSMDLIQRICDSVAIVVHGDVLATGTMRQVRGRKTLEDRFVELAGGRKAAEGMEWLHSFSD